jgi:hypothetical protein
MRTGVNFICELPYTEDPRQWNLTAFQGQVVAVHPEPPRGHIFCAAPY